MSYKVLARKWRPQHFRDMIGQEHVLKALINALDTGRLHHAYLFTGMRGVGKTTIARIFAKCLNCVENGISASPCGQCTVCRAVEEGSFIDLVEVDAASRTKVDETRELLENVAYLPSQGRYKVYLIDEVHMFSTASFNALLKTLEEPPEHVKFLLATTDPQKVPVTVLSRCLQFNLRRMALPRLSEYLESILVEESIDAERPALDLIANAAEGSVRDALSLVEQAAAFGEGAVRTADVQTMLGRVSTERLFEVLSHLAEGNAQALFDEINALAEYAPDYAQLLGELLSVMHRVAMRQSVAATGPAEADHEQARLSALTDTIDATDIQLYYQIGLQALRDLPHAPDVREAFDMALLRMLCFTPQTADGPTQVAGSAPPALSGDSTTAAARRVDSAGGAERSRAVSRAGAAESSDTARAAVSPQAVSEPLAQPSSTVAEAASPPGPASAAPGLPATEPPTAIATAADPVPASASRSSPAAQDTVDSPTVAAKGSVAALNADHWPTIVSSLGLAGMPQQLADNTVFDRVANGCVMLQINAQMDHLLSPRFVARLKTAISDWCGEALELNIAEVEVTLATPAVHTAQKQADAMSAARSSIEQDPHVRKLVDEVDGVIDDASVRPRSMDLGMEE